MRGCPGTRCWHLLSVNVAEPCPGIAWSHRRDPAEPGAGGETHPRPRGPGWFPASSTSLFSSARIWGHFQHLAQKPDEKA